MAYEYFSQFDAVGYASVDKSTHVIMVDGYFILNQGGSGTFFVSKNNSFTISALDFASAEGDPDNLLAIISNKRDVFMFGTKTTEVFVDTGNADFPFERSGGGFNEIGLAAPFSLARGGGVLFWLGQDETGRGVVYLAQGLSPQRISTSAIEQAISNYTNIYKSTAFCYSMSGSLFYVLNFTEATWVYNVNTQMWHERAYTNNGTLERHRADCHAYISTIDTHMVGDYSNNKIYKFNENYYLDDTTNITRMRVFPHFGNLKYSYCNSLEIDMEVGVGLNGTDYTSDPSASLSFSDDGGKTFGNENIVKIGKIGEYKKRVIWRRLGKFRDRVFKFKITDPISVTLIDCEIDINQGAS